MESPPVPGTIHLVDTTSQHATALSKDGIELIPRPSADPEDPLNWSERRKKTAGIMALVYTLGTGFATTVHYPILGVIADDMDLSINTMVQGTGVMFLFLGWACLLWQPIATTFGRRGVYLTSTLALVPLLVWSAYMTTLADWYATRILIGIMLSPIESLPEVTMPDIFFAHNRGTWMGLYVFILFGSNFLGPLAAGWFTQAFGWRWCMKFAAMVVSLTFVILFFGMEETMYVRGTLEGMDDVSESVTEGVAPSAAAAAVEPVTLSSEKQDGPRTWSGSSDMEASARPTGFAPARSHVQKLMPFVNLPGRPSTKAMFKGMYVPLVILVQFPTVFWAGLIYGINLSWYNVMNGTLAPVMGAAPYNWTTGEIGSLYTGPIIGAALGSIWAGVAADKITLRMARRNNGIREPEQRLWMLALSSVMSCIGLITWGVGAAHDVHWAGLGVALGILVFSVVTGGSVALSYNVDCFKDISHESTTSIIIVRNTLGFAISYGITPWYTNMGLQNCFIMAAFLSLGCTATFLIMVWKGKDLRRWSAPQYWKMAEAYAHGL